uniref:Peptidase M16 N-terminal domain-containing protein n=1 Tax=Glossina palpalis gambiensis TaxID=67801 RepID=A0A1B0C4J2_9MUSC
MHVRLEAPFIITPKFDKREGKLLTMRWLIPPNSNLSKNYEMVMKLLSERRRGFAAAANPRPLGQPAQVQTKVLENKVVVASAESQLPICRVSITFRAGARFENYESLGASHMLRIAGSLSSQNATAFALTRNLQQKGVSLSVTSDREVVSYTVESTLDNVECGLHYLQEVVQPAFKPWELSDAVPWIKTQVAAVPPQVRAVELAHKSAFRHGLGNSVYIPKFHIGSLSSETLLHYVANNCTASRCAVVGLGVEHDALVGFARSLPLKSGDGKSDSSTYHGGDARKDTPGNYTHVAVAGQGAGLSNQKEALAFSVLQYAMGAGAVTKRGNVNGAMGQAVHAAVGEGNFAFAALNASYLDAGLFGFVVSADAQKVGKAITAATKVLKSGSVSENDVSRGKALLKLAVLEAYGTDKDALTEMGVQACLTKQVQSADALVSAIDSVSAQDVQAAAKKAGSSNLSVGAVGNLSHVPYASELV